jgi:hypothetical protein
VARMHAGPSQLHAGHRLQGAIAPLDGGGSFATPAAAYSLRKLKSSYTGPGIKLRRASDSLTQDINFLGFTGFTGAPLDVAAANAFCAATTCFAATWYDQGGAARHMVQATPASQPQFIFNCNGALPCIRFTATARALQGPNLVPATGVISLNRVVNRAVGTLTGCYFAANFVGNHLHFEAGASVSVYGGASGVVSGSITSSAWHSVIGVINGASSALSVDGSVTAGSAVGNTVSGAIYLAGTDGATCDEGEALIWDNYPLSLAEQQALTSNQRGFWGF